MAEYNPFLESEEDIATSKKSTNRNKLEASNNPFLVNNSSEIQAYEVVKRKSKKEHDSKNPFEDSEEDSESENRHYEVFISQNNAQANKLSPGNKRHSQAFKNPFQTTVTREDTEGETQPYEVYLSPLTESSNQESKYVNVSKKGALFGDVSIDICLFL